MVRRNILFLAALAGLVLAAPLGARAFRSAHPAATRAFYYWRTDWSPSTALAKAFEANEVKKLYLRFFDVSWEHFAGEARPLSPLHFRAPAPVGVEVVPVVYIVNEVFLRTPYAQVEGLADHIFLRVRKMGDAAGVHPRELQIDCDWTDSSKRNYFHFLSLLGGRLHARGQTLSATLRLHQVKYAERTGVPPVDRGMVMFYNFGRIEAAGEKSSIFNEADALRYSSYLAGYPLPLGLSLPVFHWIVHSRSGKVLGLLEKIEPTEIASAKEFAADGLNRFRAQGSFFFRGRYFRAGDLLLVEESTPATTEAAARLARSGAGWQKSFETIALFDLDERNLSHYAQPQLQKILALF